MLDYKSKSVLAALWLVALSCAAHATRSVNTHLGAADIARLDKVFSEGLASEDLQAVFYSALNAAPSAAEKAGLCKGLLALHEKSTLNDYEKDFYLVEIQKRLGCTEKLPEAMLTKVYAATKANLATTQEIYYRIQTHRLLGVQIDEAATGKIVKKLQELLKKEDSLLGLGYAFHAAAELGSTAAFVADRVSDALVQADEVDGRMLQFEGGLSITALLINGALKVSKAFQKPQPFTAEQSVKLANYFLSRRSVQTPKGGHVLLEALRALNEAGTIAPICIQVVGNGQIHADSPQLNVALVDLLGKALAKPPQSVFGKVQAKKGNSVLAEKVQFVAKSSDRTIYAADLTAFKPTRGVYTAEIVADSTFKQSVQFRVVGRVKVTSLEVGVAEADASSVSKRQSVIYPKTLGELLQADHTQKLVLKAALADEGTGKVVSVHQAFVRLYNAQTDEEIIFVAEQDTSKAYKFDMDVGSHAGNFGHKSGKYQIHLIVGDALLSNSFQWHVADVQLKFSQDTAPEAKTRVVRSALPEIVHQFRPPEKRPPRIVSDIFTGLCLTPLVLLFVFWGKLGINVSNFSLAPSTIGFHLGLGGMLALFALFWLQLNMFQTLRLLIPIALFTFLCGNRLLRRIYSQRIAKNPGSAAVTGVASS